MDWQLRIALVVAGALLIGYVFYDYQKKKKRQQENDQLKKKYGNLSGSVDGAGFDMTGVGTARLASTDDDGQDSVENSELSEPLAELSGSSIENFITSNRNDVVGVSENNSDTIRETDNPTREETVSKATEGEGSSSISEPQPSDLFESDNSPEPLVSKPALVLSLILQAPEGCTFKARDFLPIFLSQGLRHGEMDIFHRRIMKGKQLGPVLFSLANGIAPGTFNIDQIDSFETPALALFMTVPGPEDAQVAFDAMYKTTKLLKQELGGEILDETRSNYTAQTHNHRLDQIQEYNRQHS
jgi:cell division protein ZipA